MDIYAQSLAFHREMRGKIEVTSRVPTANARDLSLAYTPGVAEACRAIAADAEESFALTRRWNTVAVVSNGTAVLGLGDIGPLAAMPVMEGKCALFRNYGGIDAIPIVIEARTVDEIVETVARIAPSFGGINLEDIKAPECFEAERRLIERLPIPVFHDDQHGTAIVVLAALLNALTLVGKNLPDIRIAISGAGAAGTAIAELLLACGAVNVVMVDKSGILCAGDEALSPAMAALAQRTNPGRLRGGLADALTGSDVFIGVSAGGIVSGEMVSRMNRDAIVFAMANPAPEIMPDAATAAGARIVASGRSDFPNQVNNVLAFPGVFRGALDARARAITPAMKLAAAHAIAQCAAETGMRDDFIIPPAFDLSVQRRVAEAVCAAAAAPSADA